MHKISILIIFLCTICLSAFGQNELEIKIKITDFDEGWLKLGYHYGSKQYIQDSVKVKDQIAVFQRDTALQGGIYFVIVPQHGYFELLMTEDQKFSVETTLGNYINKMEIKGSKENEQFYEYVLFLSSKKAISNELVALRDSSQTEKEREEINEKLQGLDTEVKAFQAKYFKKYADTFYTKYLKAFMDVEVPEAPKLAEGENEKTWRSNYFKEHYFDNIDWNDKNFARTPIIEKKVDFYLDKMLPQIVDTLKNEMNKLMVLTERNPEVHKFLMAHFLNKYSKSKIMGFDALYVYMVDSFYAKGKAPWVDSIQLYRITDQAEKFRPNLIGKIAPNFRLQDKDGKYHTLHDFEDPYVLLYFWDPDCGHCKKSTPVVKEFGENPKYKDVKIIAITTEHEEEKWYKYLEKNPSDWLHLRDFKYRSKFRQDYDISGTPRIFILDKNKKIVAKRLPAKNLASYMDRVMNLPKTDDKKAVSKKADKKKEADQKKTTPKKLGKKSSKKK